MRWLKRSVVLCLLMVVLTPARADAWFEWLDYLSGPGPFYGYKIDFRVACFGSKDVSEKTKQAERLLQVALVRTFDVNTTGIPSEWTLLGEKLAEINSAFPVLNSRLLADFQATAKTLTPEHIQQYRQQYLSGKSLEQQLVQPSITNVGLVPVALHQAQTLLDQIYRAQVSVVSTGIFVSLCSPDIERRYAINLGFTSLQAFSEPDFANDHSIRLNTFTGGLSYRLFDKENHDFFDVGFLAGVYRFGSRGFNTFQGPIVEPYLDVHGPTSWVNRPGLKQLASLVTFRAGVVWFPGGFESEAFAATTPETIPGSDPTFSFTIYFDIAPLLRHRGRTFNGNGM